MATLNRRHFTAAVAATLGALPTWLRALPAPGPGSKLPTELQGAAPPAGPAKLPVAISSANGFRYGATAEAYARLAAGVDTLEAAISGVNKNEENPADMSVGYGSLPDEDGVVTCDACCIHGPTMQMGAVGALAGFLYTSRAAQAVMNDTDQVMLVGDGAARFAEAAGCKKSPGLTEVARQRWLLWKMSRSLRDAWGPGLDSPSFEQWQKYKAQGNAPLSALEALARQIGIPDDQIAEASYQVMHPPHGTINCLAANAKREISGVTTTAGRAFKIPGRCGDSPIIGAGCYVDGEVGGAGSTGRGEENIRIVGGHTVVEQMRLGKTPQEACLEALRRIAHLFRAYPGRLQQVDIQFYALRNDGQHGAASLWGTKAGGGGAYAVNDGANRTESMAYLMERAR